MLFGNLVGNFSVVKRTFTEIIVTNEFTTMLFQFHQVRNDEHLSCKGSIVTLQTTDKGAIPVRCKSYSIDRNFALIFVTKENTTLLFLFLHDRIEEHHWRSGSIVDFQAIDMGSILVRCKSYNNDRNFAVIFVTKENTTRFFSFFHDAIQEHHWCSRNKAAFQAIDTGSIQVRRKITNRIRTFSVNHASEGFRFIVLFTVRV